VPGGGNSISYVGRDNISNAIHLYLDNGHNTNGDPNLELLHTLLGSRPNALWIICVVIAFSTPPSVEQISSVLGLLEEEVRESTEDLAKYLDKSSLETSGRIQIPELFALTIYRSFLQHMGRAHRAIAWWCLQPRSNLEYV
jgi:hypothetical protein